MHGTPRLFLRARLIHSLALRLTAPPVLLNYIFCLWTALTNNGPLAQWIRAWDSSLMFISEALVSSRSSVRLGWGSERLFLVGEWMFGRPLKGVVNIHLDIFWVPTVRRKHKCHLNKVTLWSRESNSCNANPIVLATLFRQTQTESVKAIPVPRDSGIRQGGRRQLIPLDANTVLGEVLWAREGGGMSSPCALRPYDVCKLSRLPSRGDAILSGESLYLPTPRP